MSQFRKTYLVSDTGTGHVGDLNNRDDAVDSQHSGAAEPSYALPGLLWVDNSAAPIVRVRQNVSPGVNPIVATLQTSDALLYRVLSEFVVGPTAGIANHLFVDASGAPDYDVKLRNPLNTADLILGRVNGTTWTPYGASGTPLVPGMTLGPWTFISAGGPWNKPAGLLELEVWVIGGGGGGGSLSASVAGGGGGGGGAAYRRLLEVALGASETITIGAGGAPAGAGGTTSFGALLSATGGAAGTTPGSGGAGGVGAGGDHNMTGHGGGGGTEELGAVAGTGGRGGGSVGPFGSGGTLAPYSGNGVAPQAGSSPGGGGSGGHHGIAAGAGGAAGLVAYREIF